MRAIRHGRAVRRQRLLSATAYGSAVLALLSAGVSAYWTAGGTALLSTVGGELEVLARRGGTPALVVGGATTALKLCAVPLSLLLVRPLGRRLTRVLARTAFAGGALLTVYGAVQVAVGGLALLGLTGATPADPTALRWHVLLWDPWFLVWGLLLCTAALLRLRSPDADGSRPDAVRSH